MGWGTTGETSEREHWCPNKRCVDYGKKDESNVRFVRRYGKRATALFRCRTCGKTFSERNGTPLFGLKMEDETFFDIVTCVGECNGVRATGRIVGVKPDTVTNVIERMGEHARRVLAFHLRDLWPGEVQLDELWSFVRKKERNLTKLEEMQREFGDCWVWVAFDPETKIVLGVVLGKRTKENAVRLLKGVRAVLADGCLPLFTSDELPCYRDAIVEVFGKMKRPRRNGRIGRFPIPRPMPGPNLFHAVVHKVRENNRVVRVERRVVLGKTRDIDELIENSDVSTQVNTSFEERQNGKFRGENARLTRRTLKFSKRKSMLMHSVNLGIAYGHFCRPHAGLRKRDWGNSKRKWIRRTPMMAQLETDHVWSVKELVLHRVPDRNSSTPFGGA